MENLPEHPPADANPSRIETEFSLLHYRRRGSVAESAAATSNPVWRALKWIAGLLMGALLGRWLTGHFP